MNRPPLALRGVLLVLATASAVRAADAASKPSDADAAYVQTTNGRADKIVATLEIRDAVKATSVRDVIAQFYRDLHVDQAERDARIKAAKENVSLDKEARAAAVKAAQTDCDAKRSALHQAFVDRLAAELTPEQLEKVKDGLTYGTLEVTWNAYQKMLPNLTDEQRKQIYAWLVEAREHAMDGFTSDEKHGWFGKYKGRINNYLSKAGYNMKEAEKGLTSASKPTAK